MQWIRSALFTVLSYGGMIPLAILFLIPMLIDRRFAVMACKWWCVWALWLARVLVGITTEVRGTVPTEECVIASKHQSFLDIIVIFHALPQPKFIMKHSLLYAPILGQYAYRLGCVPVKRGRRAEALAKMVDDVKHGLAAPGQLVIYPQGTRVAPGVKAPYKVGTAVLYKELGQPCVPAATNVGALWPRKGILKHPGHGVVEFLDRIPAGEKPEILMRTIEVKIEEASDRLLEEVS
ncbi:MAG: lysophospholipid acyltransferase family protein [Shimia sp.]